ncbi:Rv0361 family membrane protein [Micromonospora sonneratiae]|uniref:DUF4878 domain-containing protein n=1 Tax=Micromonospora sonneratiae TaxID=1184706 RepID=A0ABW3YJE6_9ACTN
MAYERALPYRRRRRRNLRTVLGLVGFVVLVCCVGAAGLGLWNYQSVRRSTDPARAAADAFLRDLTAGDHVAAYDRLCPATRQRWNRAEFTRRVAGPPKISRYDIRDVAVDAQDGRLRITIAAELTREGGVVDRHEFSMVEADDGWRVCGDPF